MKEELQLLCILEEHSTSQSTNIVMSMTSSHVKEMISNHSQSWVK